LYFCNQMRTRDQILTFLTQNKKLFRDNYHIIRIGIFGSYARGDQNIKSDIDLLVEFEDDTQDLYDLKLQIKDFFRTKLGIEVDICREKYIKPRIKKSILKETIYAD
jgi:predicted nucleotidyltransferase